jgi:predicted dehydrogenase
MCAEAAPEFVFVLGRHCDMAEVCRALIEWRIPFAVEKPAGISLAEVSELARLGAERKAFAAIPFVFRQSRMVETMHEVAGDDVPLYMSFKFVAGSVDRYRSTGCEWMLSRGTSGGGCMLNLGIHFIDLALFLMGPGVRTEAAMMSNAVDGVDVEDHGVVLLRSGAGACLIETGYIYPAPHMTFDMHFSIRTPRHHFAAKDATGLEVIPLGGEPRFVPMPMTNPPYYPAFVHDVLARAAHGEPPLAGLPEMAAALRLLEAAYAKAPLPPIMQKG